MNFPFPTLLLFIASTVLLIGCEFSDEEKISPLGKVEHPQDNPYSDEKAVLGKRLFFDERMSLDNSVSCASCHIPEKAFTDGRALSEGVGGKKAFRNAPTLYNVGFAPTFMFDAHVSTLEQQALVPIHDTNEMSSNLKGIIDKLSKDNYYVDAARKLFNRELDPWVITRSLATFQRTLISDNSGFDHYLRQG